MNPTPFHGWRLPTPGEVPWYATVGSLVGGIDTALATIPEAAPMRVTVALSHYVSGAVSASLVAGAWQTVSCAPFGASTGGFAVVGSASLVTLRLEAQVHRPAGSQNVLEPCGLRVVLTKDGASFAPMGNSGWSWWAPGAAIEQPMFSWTGSIGPGTYTARLETTGPLVLYLGDRAVLWAEEVAR